MRLSSPARGDGAGGGRPRGLVSSPSSNTGEAESDMGYLRKALSITTLGLSNLVLEDDSEAPLPSPKTRPRARKRPSSKAKPKTRARAKPATSNPSGERKTARPKPRPARAKPKPPTRTRTARTRTTPAKPARTTQAKPVAAQQPRAAAPPRPAAPPKAQTAQVPTSQIPTPARPSAPTSGVAIALDRIAKLHQRGELTDREFAAAKARILGTTPPPSQPPPEAGSAAVPAIEANVAAARRLAGYAESDRDRPTTTPGASRGI